MNQLIGGIWSRQMRLKAERGPIYLAGFLALFAWNALFAADKNGVSPNSISLPKGPGSIEGLGDVVWAQPFGNAHPIRAKAIPSRPADDVISINLELLVVFWIFIFP